MEQEKKKIEVETIQDESLMIAVEDGFELEQSLRKEADRQEALKIAEKLNLASRNVAYLPAVPAPAAESALADEFEVYEEDD